MLKRWLLRLLASLLTATLCSVIITTVLHRTVLNPKYLEAHISAINGYNRLSDGITAQVAHQIGAENNPQSLLILHTVISPAVIQQKVNGAISGLQGYYQGSNGPPTIGLGDIAAQAQSLGVPLSQNSDLLQTVTLGPKQSTVGAPQRPALSLSTLFTASLVLAIVLVILIGFLSWRWQRYKVLPGVLISVGFTIGVLAVVLFAGPGELSRYVTFSGGSSVFAKIGSDLVTAIAQDLAHRFGVIAASSLILGTIARLVVVRLDRPKPQLVPLPSRMTTP